MTHTTPDAPQTQDEQAPSPAHEKAKRLGLFRHFSYGTIAAIGLGAAGIGLGSLGLEVLMAKLLSESYGGTMLGLPFPFISMPLGMCAIFMAILVARQDMKLAMWPATGAVLYWATALTIWITT